VLDKIRAPLKEFGFASGLLYLADHVLRRASTRTRLFAYELMVQPIPSEPPASLRALRAFEHRDIRPGDPVLAAMPPPPHVIEARFRQGAVCLGTFKKERFVGYIWLAFGSYEEDEARCTYVLTPKRESVFDFDLYIFPEFRFGLGFAAIWQNAMAMLRSRGVRQSFSRVTRFNIASRKAHAHLGAPLVARATILKLWALEAIVLTIPPYAAISVSGRPRLRLRADVLQRSSTRPPA
jgi:hypothetical protein